MLIFRGARNVLWTSKPLITLGVLDRSRCGAAVRILRSLAQPSWHFGPVRSLSLWRGANFEIPHATFSALWACQITLVVARCEFWDPSRNLLGTLGVSDHSRCGAVRILRSLTQPSRHFGRVRSLSLWRGANFDSQGDLAQRSCQEDLFYRHLVQTALIESLYRDILKRSPKRPRIGRLVQRACHETSCRDLLRSCLPRGLLQRSCQESSDRKLVQRSGQDTSSGYLVQIHCIEILCKDLAKNSCIDLARRAPTVLQRACTEIFCGDLL